MPKSKALTPEQRTFLTKFLGGASRKQEKKLSDQYKDFLRRKTKVLTEVYKLPMGDPTRKALEAQVQQIDESKEQDGAANFKGAFESLAALKSQARKAARGKPPLTPNDVAANIQRLSRSGFARKSQTAELLAKMETLCVELRKPENRASSCKTLDEAIAFRSNFEATEEQLRTQLLALSSAKTSLMKFIDDFPLQEKEQAIRKELAFLLETDPTGPAHLPALLDQAMDTFKANGQPIAGKTVEQQFDIKVVEFEKLLAECKNISRFQQRENQNLPDEFKHLEERDQKRLAATELLLNEERSTDQDQLSRAQEKPKQVHLPYQWDLCADYQNFGDDLPDTVDDITPDKARDCGIAGKQLIRNLLISRANDPDLLFDLSIQTQQSLTDSLLARLNLDVPTDVPQQLIDSRDDILRNHPGFRKPEIFSALSQYITAKERWQVDGNVGEYARVLIKLSNNCAKRLEKIGPGPTDPQLVATKKQLEDFRAAIQPEFDLLNKANDFAQTVAKEMCDAINEGCPNTASREMQALQVKMSDGKMESVNAPTTITFNDQPYTVTNALGAGTNGAAFRYQNAEGKSLVLKALLDKSETAKVKFAEELKMHKHLMGGDDEGKDHVLKIEGSVRGPDGSLYMLMEEAGGGALDKISDNLRALGASGVISREAQNAITQHLIRQAVTGLKYLQDCNMTHHDIKADNYFLGADGTVKLADFGSSQTSDNAEGEVLGPALKKDLEGAPLFRSPEFVDSSNTKILTGKADTFSLGVMISKLTSPTNAQERTVSTGLPDFKSPKVLTALDRLKNAMLDEDPTKRPTIESVQYSSFLSDDHDPGQVQALFQASLAYSQKVGREVGSKQGDIDSLQASIIQNQQNSAAENDEKLTVKIQSIGNLPNAIRDQLGRSTDERQRVRGQLPNFEILRQDPKYAEHYVNQLGNLLKGAVADALRFARNAERLFQLGNLNDNALQKEIADELALNQREADGILKWIQDLTAEKRKEIAAINERPDVKQLVADLKKAEEALLRGPDAPPGQTQPTPEALAKAVGRRREKLEKILPSVVIKDLETWQRRLARVNNYVTLKQFDKANGDLDRIEKYVHKQGGVKLFEKQMKEVITQLQTASLEPEAKRELEKLIREAIASAESKNMDQAYERYQKVTRRLRDIEIQKELPRK